MNCVYDGAARDACMSIIISQHYTIYIFISLVNKSCPYAIRHTDLHTEDMEVVKRDFQNIFQPMCLTFSNKQTSMNELTFQLVQILIIPYEGS